MVKEAYIWYDLERLPVGQRFKAQLIDKTGEVLHVGLSGVSVSIDGEGREVWAGKTQVRLPKNAAPLPKEEKKDEQREQHRSNRKSPRSSQTRKDDQPKRKAQRSVDRASGIRKRRKSR